MPLSLYKFTNSPLIRSDFLSRQLCSLVMLILANIFPMHSSLVKTLLPLTLCISSAVGAPISPSESNLAQDTGDKNVKSNAPIADNAVVNDNVLSHPNKFGTLAANGFSTSPKATQTLGNPRCHVSGGCPQMHACLATTWQSRCGHRPIPGQSSWNKSPRNARFT